MNGYQPLGSAKATGKHICRHLIHQIQDAGNQTPDHPLVRLHLSLLVGDMTLLSHYARSLGEEKLTKVIDAPGIFGLTALHMAILGQRPTLVEALLKYAKNRDQAGGRLWTPLHFAVISGQDHVVEMLLDRGAEVNGQDLRGNTPLHWAVVLDHDSIAKTLRIAGADASKRNIFFGTPEHYSDLMAAQIQEKQQEFWVYNQSLNQAEKRSQRQLEAQFQFKYRSVPHLSYDFVFLFFVTLPDYLILPGLGSKRQEALRHRYGHQISTQVLPRLDIRPTLKMGMGLFAGEHLNRGQYMGDYSGNYCHFSEVAAQDKKSKTKNPYVMVCRAFDRRIPYVIDGRPVGNLTRFINHQDAKKANLKFENLWWDGLPRTILVTKRSIRAGDQLFVSYGENYWSAVGGKPL